MAKKTKRDSQSDGRVEAGIKSAGLALGDFAEDLGRLLGSAETKARTWLDQRTAIAEQLTAVRDKAGSLLQQLGSLSGAGAFTARKSTGRRRGRPPGSKNKQGGAAETTTAAPRRKRKPMSAEARAKIAAAQRARWAKQKKAKNA